jgi:hypothetical protein
MGLGPGKRVAEQATLLFAVPGYQKIRKLVYPLERA